MKITHYSFGRITVNHQTYTKDVIIFPGRVFSPWWRKTGHYLEVEDLAEVIDADVSTVIIGTGYNGTMQVSQGVIDLLRAHKIKVYVKNTNEAVALFNELSAINPVIAALHLTC
jgi:hypothetical protein